jgi:hypothetical protein
MPPDFAWGRMTDAFIPVAIAGIVIFIAFVVAALSYMRAAETLSGIIREKQPPGWKLGLLGTFEYADGDPRQPFWYWWMVGLIFGWKKLDLNDDAYQKYLWRARAWFFICLILLAAFILGLGWFTQGTAS